MGWDKTDFLQVLTPYTGQSKVHRGLWETSFIDLVCSHIKPSTAGHFEQVSRHVLLPTYRVPIKCLPWVSDSWVSLLFCNGTAVTVHLTSRMCQNEQEDEGNLYTCHNFRWASTYQKSMHGPVRVTVTCLLPPSTYGTQEKGFLSWRFSFTHCKWSV